MNLLIKLNSRWILDGEIKPPICREYDVIKEPTSTAFICRKLNRKVIELNSDQCKTQPPNKNSSIKTNNRICSKLTIKWFSGVFLADFEDVFAC